MLISWIQLFLLKEGLIIINLLFGHVHMDATSTLLLLSDHVINELLVREANSWLGGGVFSCKEQFLVQAQTCAILTIPLHV